MDKAYGVSASEGVSGSGIISLNLHATGPIKNSAAMNFSGNGMLQNAQIRTPSLTSPLRIGNANLTFSHNSAALQNVSMALGSTNSHDSLSCSDFHNPKLPLSLP